jgi:hypothetical protein
LALNGLPIGVVRDRCTNLKPDGMPCPSLEQAVSSIANLTFCGVWHTDEGDYAVFDDRGSSGSSFLMRVGETLGECMQRLGERYEVISPVE